MTDSCVVRRTNPERQAALFWEKVDKNGPNGCWLYMGFRKWDGYGWLARAMNGNKVKYLTAHRYAWILTHGQPTDGLHILHKCDNPPCCNPAHLSLGTHLENMADAKAKGRTVYGERSGSKITAQQAREIREQYKRPSYGRSNCRELAARYGLTRGSIRAIVRGRAWKNTDGAQRLHPGRVRPKRAHAQ